MRSTWGRPSSDSGRGPARKRGSRQNSTCQSARREKPWTAPSSTRERRWRPRRRGPVSRSESLPRQTRFSRKVRRLKSVCGISFVCRRRSPSPTPSHGDCRRGSHAISCRELTGSSTASRNPSTCMGRNGFGESCAGSSCRTPMHGGDSRPTARCSTWRTRIAPPRTDRGPPGSPRKGTCANRISGSCSPSVGSRRTTSFIGGRTNDVTNSGLRWCASLGSCSDGIPDSAAPPEVRKRAQIADAEAVITVDSYVLGGKRHLIYDKVVEADGPRAVVLPRARSTHDLLRDDDLAWEDFLGDRDTYDAVSCHPGEPTNILFSSGTTKDPKGIPWTHTTPIKSAADAYLHLDVRPSDVLAWPTSFGWMMGPWLTYASLVNDATMALYVGSTTMRAFGEFVDGAGVTMLGVVPKLVRSWKSDGAMEGLDWHRIRLFTSTAEPSTPEEMLYLMFLAGYRPIIEYCGGTEIGGGYITGTVVQPCAPSTFTTPALGLDFVILDDGQPARRGEVFLVPPSIGLSTDLLNYDNEKEYYDGVPKGPHGGRPRRQGDQIERLGGGYYRHLGRIDDMININGVKTSSEEVRSAIGNDLVYDSKPIAVDLDGSGQHRLVVYAVPRDARLLGSDELRIQLRGEFQRSIKANLNPLLAHVEDVVLVSELPQAGPGKTRTMKDLRKDYLARKARS